MTISQSLQAFHFIRPAWLAALPVAWVLAAWLARRSQQSGKWTQLIDADLLPGLRLDRATSGGLSPWPWLVLAWSMAIVALSGPSWEQSTSNAYRAPAAWMLVLDLSPSMASADISPSRVTRARYAMDDLLDGLRDARVGLTVFSDQAFTVAPLTDDVATVRGLLPPLAPDIMPSAGDQLAPALDRAGKLLAQSGTKERHMVVLSDGFADKAAALVAAARLKAQGVTLDVVGILPPSGLDASADLRQVASVAGGHYVALSAMPTFIANVKSDVGPVDDATQAKGVQLTHWRDGGIFLLPLLLFVVALLARRRWI